MNALELGFTTEDLRTIKFARLLFLLRVKTNSIDKAIKKANGPKEATQADIKNMLIM